MSSEHTTNPTNPRPFVFHEGPPTANGRPGVHHLFNRALKDCFLRWAKRHGQRLTPKAGWDAHGLPVELEVEKSLGKLKRDMTYAELESFSQACLESVRGYRSLWETFTAQSGLELDLERAYCTSDTSYVSSVWWALKELWTQGRLVERQAVTPWCPSCRTSLASHEVEQGHTVAQRTEMVYKAPVLDAPGLAAFTDASFLVWTTTPWTLPGGAAVALHPEAQYALVETERGKVLSSCTTRQTLGLDGPVVWQGLGKSLEGLRLAPPWRRTDHGDTWSAPETVLVEEWVNPEAGTGCVHLVGGHSLDDYQTLQRHELPCVDVLAPDGTHTAPELFGLSQDDATTKVLSTYQDQGLLWSSEKRNTDAVSCWRCKTLLVERLTSGWFVPMSTMRQELSERAKEMHWVPEHVGEGRFMNWVEGALDWCVSRSRVWGTPLPLWRCTSCHKVECVGSVWELEEKAGVRVTEDLDVHRPRVDRYTWSCSCGDTMHRVADVCDVWLDSGAMPFAQHGYPHLEGSAERVRLDGCADLVVEGVDQTRGWFYSLLALAVALGSSAPYRLPAKTVVVHDLVLDAEGRKMSKSHGNTVDALELLSTHDTDDVRLMLLSTDPALPRRFDATKHSKLLKCLKELVHGVYSPTHDVQKEDLLSSWLLSRLAWCTETVTRSMDSHAPHLALAALEEFVVSDMSQWYVRRRRESLAKGKGQHVLKEALLGALWLLSPFAPHTAHELVAVVSENSSTVFRGARDLYLEHRVARLRHLTTVARKLRDQHKLPLRQPLAALSLGVEDKELLGELVCELACECRVHEVLTGKGVSYQVKLDPRLLGKQFVQKTPQLLEEAKRLQLYASPPKELTLLGLSLPKETWTTHPVATPGWCTSPDLALDVRLTKELVDEGLLYNLRRQVQDARKTSGLVRGQHARVQVTAPPAELALYQTLPRTWWAELFVEPYFQQGPAQVTLAPQESL